MTLNWGYLLGTALFLTLFAGLAAVQIAAKQFQPLLYWATIVASTTAGTTMADFADRSLGIGYAGGSALLFVCLMATLAVWYWAMGSISVTSINNPKAEAFYWLAITFSQTLGTALGDWLADSTGYEHGVFIFAGGLTILAAAYYFTPVSRVFLCRSAMAGWPSAVPSRRRSLERSSSSASLFFRNEQRSSRVIAEPDPNRGSHPFLPVRQLEGWGGLFRMLCPGLRIAKDAAHPLHAQGDSDRWLLSIFNQMDEPLNFAAIISDSLFVFSGQLIEVIEFAGIGDVLPLPLIDGVDKANYCQNDTDYADRQ